MNVDSYSGFDGGSNAVDGDIGSRWLTEAVPGPHWCEINLLGTYSIDSWNFYSGHQDPGHPGFVVSSFSLQYWNGSAWVDIPETVTTGNTNDALSQSFAPVTTTRVRFVTPLNNVIRVKDIQVFGMSSSTTMNIAPLVGVTSPVKGEEYTEGDNIVISAVAEDPDGSIDHVDFYLGSVYLGTDYSAPYSFTWSSVPRGDYTIYANAIDNAGLSTTSSYVDIKVVPPGDNVTLLKPVIVDSEYATYEASNAVDGDDSSRWISADTVGPHWCEIDLQGTYSLSSWTLKSGHTPFPGEFAVSAFSLQYWNGTTWIDIPETITTGNTSDEVTQSFVPVTTNRVRFYSTDDGYVRVKEIEVYDTSGGPSNYSPIVSITSPTDGTTINEYSNITIIADASDPDGSIASVEFFQNGISLGTDSSAPYSLTWNNLSAGSYSLTTIATDNVGATTESDPVSITVTPSGPATNVAYQKPVTVSSNPETASNAVDGVVSISSRWISQSGGPHWCEIDLQGTFQFSSWVLYCGKTSTFPINDFSLQYWNGSSWVDIPETVTTGNQDLELLQSFSPVTTTKVRFYSTDNVVRVKEIEVYGN